MTDLTLVGAGLIGCSFAAAARKAGLFQHISAVEPDAEAARRALALGHVDALIDEPAMDAPVMLACPSNRVVAWLGRLAAHTAPVFDVASVKGALLAQLEADGGGCPTGFVPCHPIAGRERSGPDAADPELFRKRLVIITPTPDTDPVAIKTVVNFWQSLGAIVEEMDPAEHDRVYARTSHLPHLLAFAYLLGIESDHLHHSGGGFRDFSRIGASDPDMWTAIFDLNREALLEVTTEFQAHLNDFVTAIESGDQAACERLIAQARARRLGLEAD